MNQEYLSFSDLSGLNSSPDAIRSKFQEIWGKRPDGIALNLETYYNAVQPPITQQYSHYCYKTLGDVEFGEDKIETPAQAIVGSNTVVNESESEAESALTVDGAWEEQIGYTSSITAGLTYHAEIGIEGVFKIGSSFSVSVTAGTSNISSVKKGTSATVTVKVPPRSKVNVQMVATMQKEKLNFKVPIRVSGMFGANFPDRVQDHYFWFNSAQQLLPTTSGVISGIIEGTAAFNVHTVIGKPTPL
jgi:Clostridium epsilon toxin ETX/Bacillus mosquitocidal toxin MTX2